MPRPPKVDWRLLVGLTVLLLALTLALGTAIIWRSQTDDRALIRDLRASQRESIDLQQCRARFAGAVSRAEADWQVAFGNLLEAIARREDVTPAIQAVAVANDEISAQSSAQSVYLAAPTLPCPIGD